VARQLNVAVLGATGLVGRTFLRVLEERNFPVKELRPLASERSEGKTVKFQGKDVPVRAARADSFDGIDLAFFSVDEEISKEMAPLAARAGAIVIDDSAAWRMDPTIPLVVPEVNGEDAFKHNGIIAGPNCSTIQMVVALAPLHRANPITRIIVDSYQAVSGTGSAAIDELRDQTFAIVDAKRAANGKGAEGTAPLSPFAVDQPHSAYPHPIAFNVLPHIGGFRDNGYTSEEMKLVNETRKIMHAPDIAISATTVRVPVELGHSEAVHAELTHPMTAAEVRQILAAAPGVAVVDEPAESQYPLPLQAAGRDEVFVGRIRNDISHPHGVAMWIVSDNLRKGAALNAVQVAELLFA